MGKNPSQRDAFSNVSNNVRLSVQQMCEHLSDLTGGWPKCISGALCGLVGERIEPLASSTALFAWIDQFAAVEWRRGGVSKEEFYEGLRQRADRYTCVSYHPHFPKLEGVYYHCKWPKAQGTGLLDQFVDRFSPASPVDRELLKGLVMTTFWGGQPGRRPMFVVTSQPESDARRGCGVGKTSVAEMTAKLVGGYVSVRASTSQDRVLAGLLSPAALSKRVALVDNLKTYRFSNDFVESLVTCEDINGHRLHHGFASRPNLLTWIVTVNGASFSKDMAERSVVILLKRPKTSGSWASEAAKFITEHGQAIVADIRWHLKKPVKAMKKPGRWPDWEAQVLARLDNPSEIVKRIGERRSDIDEDDHDVSDLTEHIRECISDALPHTSPETATVKIPSVLVTQWVRRLKPQMTDRQAAQYVKHAQCPYLTFGRGKKGRYYVWRGKTAEDDTPPILVTYKVEDRKRG